MTSSGGGADEPRLVRTEFGLLYGGLFNKIRFPGRFQVDQSGNRVLDSPYNMPRIDFTGDISELYFEPDTFYVDTENELRIRKRKRNEEGEVTDIQTLKVGKLDLEATEAMRQEFVTLGEAQNQVNSVVGGELDKLKDLLNKYSQNSDDLQGFVSLLEQQIGSRVVSLEELSQNLRDLINEKTTLEQVGREILIKAYSKSEVDRKLEDLEIRDTDRAQSALRDTRALEEALYQVERSSNDTISDIRRILSDEYVPRSVFENADAQTVKTDQLDTRLQDYATTSRLVNDLTNYVTFANLGDYAYEKQEIDTRLNGIVQDLSGTNQDLTDRYINSIKTYVSYSNFANVLGSKIPQYEQLVYQSDLADAERVLRDRVQQAKITADTNNSEITVLRGVVDTLEDSILQWKQEITAMINERINSLDGDTTALQNLFQSIVDENANSIDSLRTRVTNVTESLGFGSDASARLFAYSSDLATLQQSFNGIKDSKIPSIETDITDNLNTITSNYNEFSTFKDRVVNDFLDTTNQTDVNNLIDQIEVTLAGYTKDEMRGFLNDFYNRNFGPPRYYPVRKGWLHVTINRPNTGTSVGISEKPLFTKEAADGVTYQRVVLTAPSSTAVAGDDFGLDPGPMLDRIESSYDSVDYFRIFYSNGSVYVLFPKSVKIGTGSALDGIDMRFVYDLQDTTTSNLVQTSNYTPYPVQLWRQTLRDYSDSDRTIARIDRIYPIRPWASTTRPSRFRFDMMIDCMPDSVGFTGLG